MLRYRVEILRGGVTVIMYVPWADGIPQPDWFSWDSRTPRVQIFEETEQGGWHLARVYFPGGTVHPLRSVPVHTPRWQEFTDFVHASDGKWYPFYPEITFLLQTVRSEVTEDYRTLEDLAHTPQPEPEPLPLNEIPFQHPRIVR